MKRRRLAFAVPGVLLLAFGAFRLLTQIPVDDLIVLGIWLVGALLIHDGMLSPLVVGIGALLGRVVPPRARRYVQAALITGGLVTVVAVPLILREDTQPASKALLLQDYGANLTVLLAIIAAASLALYAAQVVKDRSTTTAPVESDGARP